MKEVLQRWHNDISQLFSGIREDPDIVFDDEFYEEVVHKKQEIENLGSDAQSERGEFSTQSLNTSVSFDEVSKAIDRAKLKKAYLEIPNEIMKNFNAKILLQILFQFVFQIWPQPH